MVTAIQYRDGLARPYRRVPWSSRAWSQALYLAGGIPAQLFAPVLVVSGILVRPRGVLVLLFLGVVFLAVPLLTGIERHRLRATIGVVIPAQPVIPDRLSVRGIVAAARARATWRQLS
jgi:hypothetical protein